MRVSWKVHTLTKIFSRKVTKWDLFFNIVLFFNWCGSPWIPMIKKVTNSRYDVIIWTFQSTNMCVCVYIYIVMGYKWTNIQIHKKNWQKVLEEKGELTRKKKWKIGERGKWPVKLVMTTSACYSCLLLLLILHEICVDYHSITQQVIPMDYYW